jgi:hypothetical protein
MVFPGRPRRGSSYESPRPTPFGFRFPPEYFPIHPSRRTSGQETPASPELWLPSAQAGRTDSRSPGLPPPATFRLQGLVTLLAAYSPSGLGSLVSCCQRSWDFALRSFLLPRGFRPFPAGWTHMTLGRPCTDAETPIGRATLVYWVLTLPGIPTPPVAVGNTNRGGCSLGLFPFQGIQPIA